MLEMKSICAICETRLESELNGKRSSAWDRAVNLYATEILESVFDRAKFENRLPDGVSEFTTWALNGAKTWTQYSYAGNSLIYDQDIAERVCTPSAYKRFNCGRRNPNKRETWLDVQARALNRAWCRAVRVYKKVLESDL